MLRSGPVRLTPQEAPALGSWLASGAAHLGDLLRNPDEPGDVERFTR